MMLSVIIPCYNEGEKLINNVKIVKQYLDSLHIPYEIICINDGSKDNTREFMKKNSIENVKFYGYRNNKGKGYAIKTGINIAKGDIILFMDADLSTDLGSIKKALTEDADIIIGSRTMLNSNVEGKSFVRKMSSKISNILIRFLTGLNISDTQCGFKMMKKQLAKEIIAKQKINGWAFDVEYLYIAKLNHYSIKEIPVNWKNDSDSRVNLLKDSISFIQEIFKIVLNKKNYV